MNCICKKEEQSIWPTLQLHFIFWALHENGTNGVKVVIVTASKGTSASLCHLGEDKTNKQTLDTLKHMLRKQSLSLF